jgi:hypothetical protein
VGDAVFGHYRLSFTIAKHQILHENMSQFYITLPSDSSVKYFPNNTVAHYTTKLPETLNLNGDYEVGLSEIIYTKSWHNYPPEDCYLNLTKAASHTSVRDSEGPIRLEHKHYATEQDIFDEINKQFEIHHDLKMTFSLDDGHKVKMLFNQLSMKFSGIRLSENLRRYFGFEKNYYPVSVGAYHSDSPFDMNAGLRLMYVYSDIASYSIVGDVKSPLLRVVNVDSAPGATAAVTFSRPHYLPVSRKIFDTIQVHINTELGLPWPFDYGKSLITLHFRRKNRFLE